MSDDTLSHRAAVAKHHVDDPGGQTDVLDDLAEHPGSDARHLAGFTNHGVTWGKLCYRLSLSQTCIKTKEQLLQYFAISFLKCFMYCKTTFAFALLATGWI